jgi:hypothetical protein
MPIRNLWSLESGEVVTAEAILKNVRDSEVYFPLHDIGVDLLVVNGKKHVSVQVKESRYYTEREWRGTRGHSWHSLFKRKFLRDKEKVDFYVFLTYIPRFGEHRLSTFENKFLIVRTSELQRHLEAKGTGKKGIYFFCFNFEDKKAIEKRHGIVDYSEHLNRWDLIEKALH